ncbi:hypothetical protein [uncultured Deinococcus sp.]|uniref:hypothetical protein n=1 Tax=uncultured Deinococcus sp. TaxID=158789 RepID=UPI0025F19E79|nr:hypothetical protein [uncultured Deinococcus sp.]
MNMTLLLTTLLATKAAAREGGTVTADMLTPWLTTHVPALRSRVEALRDGATWQEVGALLEAAVQAGMALKPIVLGTARGLLVTQLLGFLIRELVPNTPQTAWLHALLGSGMLAGLIEAAFRRVFPPTPAAAPVPADPSGGDNALGRPATDRDFAPSFRDQPLDTTPKP